VKGSIPSGYELEQCGDGCLQCAPTILAFSFAPLNAPPLLLGDCIDIDLEALAPLGNDPDGCTYSGATVWRMADAIETPRIVLSAHDYGTPLAASEPLGGFEPGVIPLYTCSCEEVDLPDCCDSEPPTQFALEVGDEQLLPGESTVVHLGVASLPFQLTSVQGHREGKCGVTRKEIAWGLLR
jgi:hypothetical protein